MLNHVSGMEDIKYSKQLFGLSPYQKLKNWMNRYH